MRLGYYKMFENSQDPDLETAGSACFDIRAHLKEPDGGSLDNAELLRRREIKILDENNDTVEQYVNFYYEDDHSQAEILIPPKCRALIPTGIILQIPRGHSVRVHPRSGLSFKNGITLANCEGVIDSDYREELFVPVYNSTNKPYVITHDDRIAQGELVENLHVRFESVSDRPSRVTERAGGFGSTGTQ